MNKLSRQRALKVTAIGCITVVLICTALFVWRWNLSLSSSELRLVGRWSYRLPTSDRILEFRDDRIAVGYTSDGVTYFQDWYVSGQNLVLTEYSRRTYGDPLMTSLLRTLWLTTLWLRGDSPAADRPRSHILVWKGPDHVEMQRKSSISDEVYILRLQRLVDRKDH